MSRRRERTRRVGPVTVVVHHADGIARGSLLRWQGYSFALPEWPSRVLAAEPRGDALVVRTCGRERLLEARDAL